MPRTRRQHYVPQFYLRQFAIPETSRSDSPQIWAVPRSGSKRRAFRVNINKVALENDLYSIADSAGQWDDRVDRRMQRLESFMAETWPRVAVDADAINFELRRITALFMATLILRNPVALGHTRDVRRQIIDVLGASPVDNQGLPTIRRLVVGGHPRDVDVSSWHEFCASGERGAHKQFVTNIELLAARLARPLYERKPWWICYSDEPVFMTSDYPVACWHPTCTLPAVELDETTIYFPLSPKRMLVIGGESDRDNMAFRLVPGGHGFFNQFVYRRAAKWLFACSDPVALAQNMLDHIKGLNSE